MILNILKKIMILDAKSEFIFLYLSKTVFYSVFLVTTALTSQ